MAGGENHSPQRTVVERIVRDVLGDLAGRMLQENTAARPTDGALEVNQKVVSLADLEGRLEGITRLVLTRGAVLTPSARDELRKRGVSLASAASGASAKKGEIVLAVSEHAYHVEALVAALKRDAIVVDLMGTTSLTETVDAISRRVAAENTSGVVLSRQPSAVLCLANRNRGVRASLALGPQCVREAVAAIGTNLLVVDPRGRSLFELQRIVRELASAGGVPCPAALAKQLN